MRLPSTTAAVLVVQVVMSQTMGIYAFQRHSSAEPLIHRSVSRRATPLFSTPDNPTTDDRIAVISPSRRNVLFGIATTISITTAEVEVAAAQPDQPKGKPRLGGMPNTIRSVGNVMVRI